MNQKERAPERKLNCFKNNAQNTIVCLIFCLNLFAISPAVAENLRGNSFILSRWHRVMAHGVLKPAAQPTDDPLVAVAESGRLRLTRSKLLAKRPHSGGHSPEKKKTE